jgi:hypothetical protein
LAALARDFLQICNTDLLNAAANWRFFAVPSRASTQLLHFSMWRIAALPAKLFVSD